MIIRFLAFTALMALVGCATVGTTVQGLQGDYYLDRADYNGGRAAFATRLAENPDDPRLNYYMARFELGADNPEAARPHIEKAVQLAPDNADYRFWEGVTWWALRQPDKEKSAYEKALALEPNHLSANLYLGHNMLDQGKNAAAIERYDRVLLLDPGEPQALFNRAVALDRLGRKQDMRLAVRQYLDRHPEGPLARQGTQMLNKAGDFSWRNQMIGLRSMALKAVEFNTGTANLTEGAQGALSQLGAVLAAKPDLNLHVVAYVKGNKALAKQRALAVKEYVIRTSPKVAPAQLTPSWFGEAEIIKIDGKPYTRTESVNIFTKVK